MWLAKLSPAKRALVETNRKLGFSDFNINLSGVEGDPEQIHQVISSGEESSETGIVVAGLARDLNVYVLADLSARLSPNDRARRAVQAYHQFNADRIIGEVIGEVNNGGDLIEKLLRTVDGQVAYKAVRASHNKYVRAEPIAALYEQGRVHHVGRFPEMEEQMCCFVPGQYEGSPDRMDALVWALWELFFQTHFIEEQKEHPEIAYQRWRERVFRY
jgi:phage terminase large subunit-like protein